MATIRKKGTKFQAFVRRQGWPHQSRTFATKKFALEWARGVEHKMDQGTFLDNTNAKSTTYDDLIERYLEEVISKKRKEAPIRVDTCILRRIQREERQLCSLTLDKLKPGHFEAYRDKRLKMPSPSKRLEDGTPCRIAESTVVRELSLMSCVVQYKFSELGLPLNPASGKHVKRPVVNDERDVRLTDDEKSELVRASYRVRNSLVGSILELGFETGARRGEILSLLWDDVDLEAGGAILRDVKNTRNPNKILNRNIGLSRRAIEVLRTLPREGDRVFPMTVNAFKLSFKRIRSKVGLSHFHFHDTRHDFISRKVEAGMPIALIMAQVGHTSTRSLARYMTIRSSHLAAELDKYA